MRGHARARNGGMAISHFGNEVAIELKEVAGRQICAGEAAVKSGVTPLLV